jgi:hypothetical protein
VVWPYGPARVVFPDGSEFLDVPVFAFDLMADLALLGPVEADIPALGLGDGEALPVGSDTYLIGYPGVSESFPQPTFARGLVSRIRQWDQAGITFIQTDHIVAGGQSGGPLVSENGEVIAVSGLSITEAGYAVSTSAADISSRVARMLAGEEPNGLAGRKPALTGGAQVQQFTLPHEWAQANFLAIGDYNSTVAMSVESDNDAWLYVTDIFGDVATSVDDTLSGVESDLVTFDVPGPFIVSVLQYTPHAGDFTLTCECELVPVEDPDDGKIVTPGSATLADMDVRGDSDYFDIALTEGQVVEITVDTANMDGYLSVSWVGSTVEEVFEDDDSGGGVLGLNPQAVFRAPFTGVFTIFVRDVDDVFEGSYYLQVKTVSPTDARAFPPLPETVDTAFGEMKVYKLPSVPYTMLYPASWERVEAAADEGVLATFQNGDGEAIAVSVQDLTGLIDGSNPLDNYTQLITDLLLDSGVEVTDQESLTTPNGLTVNRLDVSVLGDQFRGFRTLAVEAGTYGISVLVLAPPDMFESSLDLYTFISDSLELVP